jgi:hypothetical protein
MGVTKSGKIRQNCVGDEQAQKKRQIQQIGRMGKLARMTGSGKNRDSGIRTKLVVN